MLPSPMRALGRFNRENSPDELHVAVMTGRTKRIKHLLRKGVHIESVNTIGQTSLFCAAYGGDYEIVELLLRLGANPNRRCGSNGAAPIHAAAYRGSRRVLRLLVEAGGDLGLRDSELRTPKDYVEKQPSPLRRQKILQFIDLLYAMTLHRSSTNSMPSSIVTPSGVLSDGGCSNSGTLRSQKLKGFFGSQMSLARKHSQSTTSVWSSCVSEVPSNSSSDELDSSKAKEIVLTENLHKNLSCHLLDQLCVTTSLPLLSPDQLQKPQTNTPAYTCGGPTVYSPFTWLGTPVTVRRPTPALSLNKQGNVTSGGDGSPDQEAVRSLLQELSFLRCLRHPGFLEVMAACHVTHPAPDHVTLVYQHVSYGSLYHHLHVQHRDLSVGCAVDILIGLVEALLFMHAHGWFHCGLSSHALHLVGLGTTKLGGFEYAMEAKVKGVGMRAEHVSRATWLKPWQAPETIVEKMVSVRSEIYAVATIIWEIWSGMPPWAGVEEEEVGKRVGSGETLPLLGGTPLSLVSYLTQYGLKWNSHERELDLQEVYTMLRSLRIQCNEDERVPAVSSWGPPSVLNTPVIGRRTTNHEASSPLSSRSSSGELSSVTKERNYEVTGIKPASHQLTRHSSSCSLASGPSSPAHQRPVTEYAALASSKQNRFSSSNGSLPTSPTHSKFTTLPHPPRPLSVFNDQDALLQSATLPALLRIASRRHSETLRQRPRKPRRKQEVEVEEEFIDDEFNSLLYDQPHMQLSIGSSENLLDSRLSFSVVDDSASSVASQHSRHLTSSDDDDEETSRRCKGPHPPLQALEETGDSDNVEDDRLKPSVPPVDKSGKKLTPSEPALYQSIPDAEYSAPTGKPTRVTTSDSESDEVFTKGDSKIASSRVGADKIRDYEPLKSFQIMKNLEKTLTNYLPTYSIGSDSD